MQDFTQNNRFSKDRESLPGDVFKKTDNNFSGNSKYMIMDLFKDDPIEKGCEIKNNTDHSTINGINGHSIVTSNGHSHDNNGKYNLNTNNLMLNGKNGKAVPPLNDKSFSFTVQVPQNVVVKVLNILSVDIETLVDDLTMPGNYVVTMDRKKTGVGCFYYKLYVEVSEEEEPDYLELTDKPGKKYRLLETKEVIMP